MNLKTGDVEGTATEITFDYEAIPASTEAFPVTGYEYLAMNYLLVDKEQQLVEVDFSITDGTTTDNRTVGSVPVRRNYRTNIYGKLLTSKYDVNVEIKPGFDPNEYLIYNVVVNGVSYNDLATAMAKAAELNKPVEFIENVTIDADNTITVEAGREVTLNLNGYVLSGITDNFFPFFLFLCYSAS